jgi:hypothetical protein
MCVPLPPQFAQSHMLGFFRPLGNKFGQKCGQIGAVNEASWHCTKIYYIVFIAFFERLPPCQGGALTS